MTRSAFSTAAMLSLAAALSGAGGQALAQETDQNRFRLEKTESGFVRLDAQTGALTLCRDENGQLTCRMAADERAAYEKELDLLEKRVTALEKQAGTASPKRAVPSEEEIETSLSIMERFMRRFMGLMEEFKDEPQPPATPNRT